MADEADTPQGDNLPAVRRASIPVESIHPMMDTAKFEQMQRSAKALMFSSLLAPSVRGNGPDQCFSNLLLIADYSLRWNVPLTMLAQCVSVVYDKLVWEGKAIAAAIEATLGVQLHYHWTGERGADDYRIYVWDKDFDTLTDEQLAALKPGKYPRGARMVDGSVGEWRTFQKDQRTPNPNWTGRATQAQLAYRGAREWGRLHAARVMLGVYGDDEFNAYEDRLVNVTPQAQAVGIVGGFTRPAEVVVDAVVEPAAETVKEAAKPKESAQQRKDRDRDERVKAETKARLEVCAEYATLGEDQGRSGEPKSPPSGMNDEQTGFFDNGYAKGRAEWEAANPKAADVAREQGQETGQGGHDAAALAFEGGHEQGLRGEPLAVPAVLSAAEGDSWTEGWHAGQAERLVDQADAGGEAADGEGDDDFPGDKPAASTAPAPAEEAALDDDSPAFPAIASFIDSLADLDGWPTIKAALVAVTKTQDWKEAPNARRTEVRVAAWTRVAQLEAQGTPAADVTSDLTAFRCFAEWSQEPDDVQDAFAALQDQGVFRELSRDQQSQFTTAIKEILAGKRQPGLGV